MGIILPNYMLRKKHFKCNICSFAYWKQTPSDVDKCPKCEAEGRGIHVTYAKGIDPKNIRDPYSQWKQRIYSDPSGKKHEEDIRMRSKKKISGEMKTVWKDSKGHIVDEAPEIPTFKGKKKDLKSY